MEPKNLLGVMCALYNSEINCGMKSFWDEGFWVFIGDESNGIKGYTTFYPPGPFQDGKWTEEEAAEWLHEAALEHFPESEYAIANREEQ